MRSRLWRQCIKMTSKIHTIMIYSEQASGAFWEGAIGYGLSETWKMHRYIDPKSSFWDNYFYSIRKEFFTIQRYLPPFHEHSNIPPFSTYPQPLSL